MTDAEVDTLRCDGIHLSTLDSVRARLAAQVAAGTFTQNIADQLFTDSPFQSNQLGARSAKFWMVSHPVDVKDSGVELLLESWGGEAVYFWQRDVMLQEMLTQIGRPRTRNRYAAGSVAPQLFGRGRRRRDIRPNIGLRFQQEGLRPLDVC